MMIGMTRLYSLTAILLLSASCSLRIPGEPETVTLRLEAAMEETGSRAGVQEDGTVLWQGKTYIGDADIDNGFRATNAAIAKMLKKGFGKDLFPQIGRK